LWLFTTPSFEHRRCIAARLAVLTYERALSARTRVGGTLALERQSLRDPGYSSTGGQFSFFAYREIGAVTLIGSASYAQIVSTERLPGAMWLISSTPA